MSASILTQKQGKVFRITFNKPGRKNAISDDMYHLLCAGLEQAQNDPEVIFTVFSGNGDFYSSGNDFNPKGLMEILDKPDSVLEKRWEGIRRFIELLIHHDKVLIALVNGPAIGIACTTLALFDQVLASEKAWFHCPFTQVGLCAEGTSSYSFPALMGHQKAAQMAIFAEKLTARDAQSCGFVAHVYPDASFRQEAEKLLVKYQQLAPQSVLATKKLLRPDNLREELMAVNKREFEALSKRWMSDETMEFMSKRFLRSKV